MRSITPVPVALSSPSLSPAAFGTASPCQEVVYLGAAKAASLRRLPPEMALLCPITFALGCVGQTGVSAYFGMLKERPPRPGDCVVVSGAGGAVGSVAGQLAKLQGCRVVGIAGGPAKCAALVTELGFDAGVDYKSPDFEAELEAAVGRDGAAIYFDNVGGRVSDAVIRCLRDGAHIVLCGQIATYDSDVPYPPPLPEASQALAERRGITRRRYLVFNYEARFPEAVKDLLTRVAGGELVGLETYRYGLADAPKAFVEMMAGGNTGKQLVEVAPPPARVALYNRVRGLLPAWVRRRAAARVQV